MFDISTDEMKGKYPEPTQLKKRSQLLNEQDMYYISLSYYEKLLTDSSITDEKKKEYNEKIGIVKKLLEKNKTDLELIKNEIPESASNVTGKLLEENERFKEAVAGQAGGKRKSKGKSKKVAKKPVASQKKQSIYKEIFGKQMKIYKMPDSRKEYVKYKGDLHLITDYKDLMKQKAIAKTKTKTKATQQKAKSKTKK